MSEQREGRKRARKGHAVMLNLPDDMMEQLRLAATRRRIPVATAARQLLGERLDEDGTERRRH